MKSKSAMFICCILLFAFACTKRNDFSKEENLLQRWAFAIQYRNYSEYCNVEAFPKDLQTFNAMYKDYYFKNIKIVDVDKRVRKGVDPDGLPFEYKNVHFIASLYNRDTNMEDQTVNGEIKIIRYISSKKKDRGWLISNKTILYSK